MLIFTINSDGLEDTGQKTDQDTASNKEICVVLWKIISISSAKLQQLLLGGEMSYVHKQDTN